MSILTFNGVDIQPVKQNAQIWLSSSDLARALGYAETDSVTKLYNRNSDEFAPNMTQVIEITETVNLTAPKNTQNLVKSDNSKLGVSEKTGNLVHKIRIFSLRGCHLIAMFARTAVAKEFRKWVLDILEEVSQSVQVKTTADDRTPLRQAVSMLVGKCSLDYSTAYTLIHQYMGVESIDEIALADLPKAVAYVHELIIKANKSVQFDVRLLQSAQHLAWHTEFIYSWYKAIEKPFRSLSPKLSYQIHDHIVHAKICARDIERQIGFGMDKRALENKTWAVGFDGLS